MATCRLYTDNRPQKVILNHIMNKEYRCTPSLHSTDCASVIHDCMIFHRCFKDFQHQYRKQDKNHHFNCEDNGYYRPFVQLNSWRKTQAKELQLPSGFFSRFDPERQFGHPKCFQSSLNLKIEFQHNNPIAICKEIGPDPHSNCVTFQKRCDQLLSCLMHHSITCDLPLVTSHPILPQACDHWAVSLSIKSLSQKNFFFILLLMDDN